MYHKRRAFNRDRISLLVEFLLLLEIKMYLLNDTQQPQQLLELQFLMYPACIYLLQVCSSFSDECLPRSPLMQCTDICARWDAHISFN